MDKIITEFNLLVESGVRNITSVLADLPGGSIIYRYVSSSYQNDPARSVLELLLLLFAIRYFLASKYSTTKTNYVQLDEDEVDELIDEWEPEPLITIPTLDSDIQMENNAIPILSSSNSAYVSLSSTDARYANAPDSLINFTSSDIYGFNTNEKFKESAVKIVRKYGVGSCGPAGFYGNQDAHVAAEKSIAEFLGTDSSILYAQGLATASSVIPCFLKRGDIIVADKGVHIGLQKGILLSRSTVFWYEHNDYSDLERTLIRANNSYRRGPLPRRFIITEAVFENSGRVADLEKLIQLKKKYKYRLLLDETWSLGSVGTNGRGLPEQLGIDRASNIEFSIGSLSALFGCGGGYCAGTGPIVEHQRITSLAYTFSATMPAYLASTIKHVADYMVTEDFVSQRTALASKSQTLYNLLKACKNIELTSSPGSPIIIFSVKKKGIETKFDLQKIIDSKIIFNGVLVVRYNRLTEHELFHNDETCIRLFVHDEIAEKDLIKAANVITKAFD